MESEPNNTIKHLVVSSGGPAGHIMYSVLRTLNLKGIWDINNIKSIYGSSIGTFIAIIIALRYDWNIMDDYLIKRPWEKIFSSSSACEPLSNEHMSPAASSSGGGGTLYETKQKFDYIYKLYRSHGLYGLKEFTEMLRPALQGKDFRVDVTFQEFYERTGIELHFIVTELNKFQIVDFSHKTHPTQSVVEACYMSCCYPFGFTPIYRDNCCYIDGGIINDYPINECIQEQKCKPIEILGVKMMWERKPANLTEKSSVVQFISTFFNQIKGNLFDNRPTKSIPNEVVCISKVFALQDWMNWMKNENYRRELVLRGETFANVFLSYLRNFTGFSSLVGGASEEIGNASKVPTVNTATSLTSTLLEQEANKEEVEIQNTSKDEDETYSITNNEEDITMV